MVTKNRLPRDAKLPYHNQRQDFELLIEGNLFSPGPIDISRPDIKPLKHFSIVGAMFTDTFKMLGDDKNTIIATLTELKQAGIPIDPLPEFHFYNLLAPINSDFLVNAIVAPDVAKTDAVIINYVWGGRSQDLVIEHMPRAQQHTAYSDFRSMYQDFGVYRNNREVSISRAQAHLEDAWSQACEKSGARVVAIRGDSCSLDTVNTDHLLRGQFYKAAIGHNERHKSSLYIGSGSLGYCFSPDAIREYAPLTSGNTLLGQRILDLQP